METAKPETPYRDSEDALAYLPRNAPSNFRKRQVVFDEHHPPGIVWLILKGNVKLTFPLHDGSRTVVDILGSGDFMGEHSLLPNTFSCERAVALDNVSLMSWTTAEIEHYCERQPRLAMALIRQWARRGMDCQARLQSFALDKTPERLVRALLGLADRLGTHTGDDCFAIPPLTHQVIADYVGTTREMVNLQMNQLRHNGSLRYSRKEIQVCTRDLRQYLRHRSSCPALVLEATAEPSSAVEWHL